MSAIRELVVQRILFQADEPDPVRQIPRFCLDPPHVHRLGQALDRLMVDRDMVHEYTAQRIGWETRALRWFRDGTLSPELRQLDAILRAWPCLSDALLEDWPGVDSPAQYPPMRPAVRTDRRHIDAAIGRLHELAWRDITTTRERAMCTGYTFQTLAKLITDDGPPDLPKMATALRAYPELSTSLVDYVLVAQHV